MIVLLTELSKYIFVLLMLLYTVSSYMYIASADHRRSRLHGQQLVYIILFNVLAYFIMFLHTQNVKIAVLGAVFLVILMAVILIYRIAYPKVSFIVLCNMGMLLSIGLVMIARLSYDNKSPLDTAVKQLIFVCAGLVVSLIVPIMIRRMRFLKNGTVLYGAAGFLLLLIVAVFAVSTHGAKLGFTLFGFGIQPSEFVKILFVFYAAGALSKAKSFRDIVIATCVAAAHVLILVLSTDLGAALIFFVVYMVMLYVTTRNVLYVGAGALGGSLASVIGYRLFSHIRVRVAVWKDPFASYDTGGYQVAQSLFAIGTGSWFGMGLFGGLPDSIPVAETDFIFSAITEEMGLIFSLCILLICTCCYLMILSIAMELKHPFYRLVALGLGTCYIFQVFLTVGGVTKFIPSTGVTLPLVSYGGSSVLSTLIMFGIIQGLYIVREDEIDADNIREEEQYYETRQNEMGRVRAGKRRTAVPTQKKRGARPSDDDRFEEV